MVFRYTCLVSGFSKRPSLSQKPSHLNPLGVFVSMKLTDFLSDVGRPIAYYPSLRKITGSTTATILLCQFIYWRGKESDPNGWLYKTSDEIEEETGLSYNEQKTARANLVSAELIEEHYARLDHQMKFRVNLNMINLLWGTEQTVIPESDNPSFGKATIHDSLNESEITSENTSIETKPAKDLIDHLLDMANFPGAKAEARRNSILSYLGERLHVNTETKAWREFAKYVDGQQQKGEKIETFVAWLLGQDKFQIQYWPPRRMMEMWPQAFVKTDSTNSPYKPLQEDNNVYVPNPNRRTS